jgi:effector-binding domain-containing protein
MEYEITVRDLPDQEVVFIRDRIRRDALSAFIGTSYDELVDRLATHGSAPHGETLVIYHESGPAGVDVEVCVPIAPDAGVGAGLARRVVPAATVAQTLHVGSYDGLPDAYDAVASWVSRNEFSEVGPSRERYVVGPGEEVPEADYWTLIETPIARVLVEVG